MDPDIQRKTYSDLKKQILKTVKDTAAVYGVRVEVIVNRNSKPTAITKLSQLDEIRIVRMVPKGPALPVTVYVRGDGPLALLGILGGELYRNITAR